MTWLLAFEQKHSHRKMHEIVMRIRFGILLDKPIQVYSPLIGKYVFLHLF